MAGFELVDYFAVSKALLWILYPMTLIILFEYISAFLDNDDDDFGGGKMIPAYQSSKG